MIPPPSRSSKNPVSFPLPACRSSYSTCSSSYPASRSPCSTYPPPPQWANNWKRHSLPGTCQEVGRGSQVVSRWLRVHYWLHFSHKIRLSLGLLMILSPGDITGLDLTFIQLLSIKYSPQQSRLVLSHWSRNVEAWLSFVHTLWQKGQLALHRKVLLQAPLCHKEPFYSKNPITTRSVFLH